MQEMKVIVFDGGILYSGTCSTNVIGASPSLEAVPVGVLATSGALKGTKRMVYPRAVYVMPEDKTRLLTAIDEDIQALVRYAEKIESEEVLK